MPSMNTWIELLIVLALCTSAIADVLAFLGMRKRWTAQKRTDRLVDAGWIAHEKAETAVASANLQLQVAIADNDSRVRIILFEDGRVNFFKKPNE